jgi:hypothetical protein
LVAVRVRAVAGWAATAAARAEVVERVTAAAGWVAAFAAARVRAVVDRAVTVAARGAMRAVETVIAAAIAAVLGEVMTRVGVTRAAATKAAAAGEAGEAQAGLAVQRAELEVQLAEARKAWAAEKGSSKNWQRTALGTSYGVTVSNCTSNPYFCNATAAVVPYCTGDEHAGNNTVASAKTWGYIFDGHTSFTAVIEELIKTRGLGDAKRVLLTGSSAGGIGALLNLDWLANRLPNADVKGAPQAGWFFPAALPGDLPDVYPPSLLAACNLLSKS